MSSSSSLLSAKIDSDSTDLISKSDSSDVDDNSSNATSSTVSLNSTSDDDDDDNNLEVNSSSNNSSKISDDDDSDFENLVQIANRVLENKSVYVKSLLEVKRKPKNQTQKLSKLSKTIIVSNILNEIKMSGRISETPFKWKQKKARRLQLSEPRSMEFEENCKTCGKLLQVRYI